ncbi:MAG: M56 family peptidase, partial [Pseudanabaena sp.]
MLFFSMHSVMLLGSLGLAWGLRYDWQSSHNVSVTWQIRWHRALFCFVLPPLLVITTAIAVLCMGSEGQMIGLQAGYVSYAIALI